MLLLCHGGKCCGVKHIYGFDWHPMIGEMPAETFEREEHEYCGGGGAGWQHLMPGKNFFKGKAPKEKPLDRLDRLLEYCKEEQPKGLIEITLVKSQKEMWHKYLEERDFEIVNEFKNSNSGATIWVYHKVNK